MSKSKLLKPTILSLSFLSILSGAAVSPALAHIQEAFPDATELMIQMILSLTPLFIIPFSLLTGRLSLKVKKRHLLLVGLSIYLLAGVGGGLMNSLAMILVMRALLGVGTGVISALSLSLIADFYHGDERSITMGQSSAMGSLGGVIMILLSGWLASFSWRYAFGVYLISLIVLVMVFFFLSEPPEAKLQKTSQIHKLPLGVYGMSFLTVLLMIVFYLVPTQIAIFLQETNLGDPGQSGISIATMNLVAFFLGFAFGSIRKHLKSLATFMALLSLSAGLIALNYVQNFPAVLISLFFVGGGIGILMPTIFLTTANLVPNELNGPALSITNSGLYLGQFISPLFFSLIGILFHAQTIRTNFFSGGVFAFIAALIFSIWMLVRKNLKTSTS